MSNSTNPDSTKINLPTTPTPPAGGSASTEPPRPTTGAVPTPTPVLELDSEQLREVAQDWSDEADSIANIEPAATVSPGGDAAREAESMIAALEGTAGTLAEAWRTFSTLLSDAASEYEVSDEVQASRFELTE